MRKFAVCRTFAIFWWTLCFTWNYHGIKEASVFQLHIQDALNCPWEITITATILHNSDIYNIIYNLDGHFNSTTPAHWCFLITFWVSSSLRSLSDCKPVILCTSPWMILVCTCTLQVHQTQLIALKQLLCGPMVSKVLQEYKCTPESFIGWHKQRVTGLQGKRLRSDDQVKNVIKKCPSAGSELEWPSKL